MARGSLLLLLVCAAPVAAAWPELASGPLQDNSFLIEEAYNQERGVVQHIGTALLDARSGDWVATFTQEWPVPDETHQLSFTVPYASMEDFDGPSDVLLNYRYQLMRETAGRPALAPRLSLVLPTGSVDDGLGNGTAGFQALLPASKQLGAHWAAHMNVGATVLPRARAAGIPGTERLVNWFGGGSVIWEPVPAVNLLAELFAQHDADIEAGGIGHQDRLIFDPGVRVGWNLPRTVQLVAGVGVPIGLTADSPDLGVLLYLSIEHAVTAGAAAERW